MTKLAYSLNGEDFTYHEPEDAAEMYVDGLKPEEVLYPFSFDISSGECIECSVDDLYDFNDVVEGMACRAADFGGEFANDWDVFGDKESHAKCNAEIREVVKKHMKETTFFQIGKITPIAVVCTAQDTYTFN